MAVDALEIGAAIGKGTTIVPGTNSYDDPNDPYGKPFYYLWLNGNEITTGDNSTRVVRIGQYSVAGNNFAITGFSPEIAYTVTRVYKPGGYNFYKLYLHTHSFTYAASGASITATCGNEDCPLTSNPTLTLNAPDNLTFSGSAKSASITASENWTTANGLPDQPDIAYYSVATEGATSGGTALTGAPTDAGYYYASITVDTDKTAYVAFTINKASITPSVSMDNYTYGSAASTPSISEGSNPGGGTVSWSYSGTANDGTTYGPSTAAPTQAGTYTVTATVAETDNYNEGTGNKEFMVSRKTATVHSGITAGNRTYDGTTNVTLVFYPRGL